MLLETNIKYLKCIVSLKKPRYVQSSAHLPFPRTVLQKMIELSILMIKYIFIDHFLPAKF